ncbi:MAG: hypothetical protein DRG69_07165 [Deltaproteobacteria bacterium]|nr:MAG: hypothetical protein DRG69_07165 [Deltaproteobacteria bacterium]
MMKFTTERAIAFVLCTIDDEKILVGQSADIIGNIVIGQRQDIVACLTIRLSRFSRSHLTVRICCMCMEVSLVPIARLGEWIFQLHSNHSASFLI